MKLYINKIIIENYSVPTTQSIDEIDDIANSIQDNIKKEIKIPSDVINSFAINETLNQSIWDGDKLKPIVRRKLITIANDFFKTLDLPQEVKMKDIIFTGSLANYNWSKFSDVDLHIVLDFSELKGDKEFKENFFYAHKTIWNQEHDITIYDFPVELYAQDIKAKLVASAVYSIKNDKWVLKPTRENFKINKNIIKDKAEKFIAKLRSIKQDYNDDNYKSVVAKVTSLKHKIKNYRTGGLEKGGEFSLENLVFKVLRRTPFMDILDSYKGKAYDKMMSVGYSLNKSEFSNNVSLSFKEEFEDEYTIEATYEDDIIGKSFFKILYDPYSDFEADFTEDQIEEIFGDEPTMVIEWVEVTNEYYRKSGVGRAIMTKTIDKCKSMGFNNIYLNASPIAGKDSLTLDELVKWYETFGFTSILNQKRNTLMIKKGIMKEYYKHKLREALNKITEAKNYSSNSDYNSTLSKIKKANELYGNDPYFRNVSEGEWVGEAVVNIHGDIKIKRINQNQRDVKGNSLGGRSQSAFYKTFEVNAYGNTENPKDRQNNSIPAKTSSSASDAAIKILINYGQVILDFIQINLPDYDGYISTGDAKDLSAKAMSADPKLEKHKLRKDFEMKIGRHATDTEFQEFIKTGETPKAPQKTLISPYTETGAERKARTDAERLEKSERLRKKRG